MRKSKQSGDKPTELSLAAALSAEIDELAPERGFRPVTADDLGDLADEVQSFIQRRKELARRLDLEIDATEKRLAELKRTKERLFPDGIVAILAEPEPPQRKPKKAKAAKPASEPTEVSVESPIEVHQAVVEPIVSAPPVAKLSIHQAEPPAPPVKKPAQPKHDVAVELLDHHFDLGKCLRTTSSLAFHPRTLLQPLPAPLGPKLPPEPIVTWRLWPHPLPELTREATPLLCVEPWQAIHPPASSFSFPRLIAIEHAPSRVHASSTLQSSSPLLSRPSIGHFCLELSPAAHREFAA